jgi:hypothetical protein
MQERRRLRDIAPTGWRQDLRLAGFLIAHLLAALTAVALPFGSHDVSHRVANDWETHATLPEHAYLPLVVALLVLAGCRWAMQGKLLRTVLLMPLISLVSFITFALLLGTHLLLIVRSNAAETAALSGFGLLSFVPWIIFIVEWIAVIWERKHLEAADPVFPTARGQPG